MVARWEELPKLIHAVESLSTWRMADVSPGGLSPPDQHALQNRKPLLASRMIHDLIDHLPLFFTPQGLLAWPDQLKWELDRRHGRSGTSTANGHDWPRLRDWWLARASGVGEEPGLEAVRTSIQVMAFLARQLDWTEKEISS